MTKGTAQVSVDHERSTNRALSAQNDLFWYPSELRCRNEDSHPDWTENWGPDTPGHWYAVAVTACRSPRGSVDVLPGG
jgi:hypothetical protein